jgi:tripartite-type tricarboxylate transporter receptor subunit TctC
LLVSWFNPSQKSLAFLAFVENKGGAGGNIGTQAFLQDKPDGILFLERRQAQRMLQALIYFANQGFDAAKDSTPVVLVCTIPNIMVVPASSPWNSLKDLMSDSKQNPGKFTRWDPQALALHDI